MDNKKRFIISVIGSLFGVIVLVITCRLATWILPKYWDMIGMPVGMYFIYLIARYIIVPILDKHNQ